MLSRRDFIKVAGVGVGVVLLNGCVPKLVSSTQTPIVNKPPTSTSVPKLTPTATPDFQSLLQKEIPLYSQAMGFDEQEVGARITAGMFVDNFGNRFGAIYDNETRIPFLLQNNYDTWQPAFLKLIAEHGRIRVGNILGSGYSAEYLKRDFNLGVLQSDMADTQAIGPNSFNYAGQIADLKSAPYAKIKDIWLEGLVWGERFHLPKWLNDKIDQGISYDELFKGGGYIRKYINKTIYQYTKHQTEIGAVPVSEIVVVAEPDGYFLSTYGLRWVLDCFEEATQTLKELGIHAILTLDNYDNHYKQGHLTEQTRVIVKALMNAGYNVNVGSQENIQNPFYFKRNDVTSTLLSYHRPVEITGLALDLTNDYGKQLYTLSEQGDNAVQILGGDLDADVGTLIFWGTDDDASYRQNLLWDPKTASRFSQPTLYDANGHPKPYYFRVRQELFDHVAIPLRDGYQLR